mmetsp:Transcript_1222/g.3819  ORF Transcript_1222/g.3819 Transcript_1222/m.3819 type:complete len:263 (-) Transcript_1222:96-884(-)
MRPAWVCGVESGRGVPQCERRVPVGARAYGKGWVRGEAFRLAVPLRSKAPRPALFPPSPRGPRVLAHLCAVTHSLLPALTCLHAPPVIPAPRYAARGTVVLSGPRGPRGHSVQTRLKRLLARRALPPRMGSGGAQGSRPRCRPPPRERRPLPRGAWRSASPTRAPPGDTPLSAKGRAPVRDGDAATHACDLAPLPAPLRLPRTSPLTPPGHVPPRRARARHALAQTSPEAEKYTRTGASRHASLSSSAMAWTTTGHRANTAT